MYFRPVSATLYLWAALPPGGRKRTMTMNTKKNVAMVLLVLSMLLWVLRKINILYIPGLSMFLLALSMVLVGVMMFQLKEKKKLAGTMIVAFGLFCIVAAIMEIRGYMA